MYREVAFHPGTEGKVVKGRQSGVRWGRASVALIRDLRNALHCCQPHQEM